ncbi:unnamed protein product [Caenorhabditis auriculariae]|uniref:Uncharacterized protein n=1 Tax=Caenorhabditis auriculariae TaxID=2777116 RepID=A0A8S1HFU4_9PELO|nr:unnamed protein product [Caenorhabditis auriculariae]
MVFKARRISEKRHIRLIAWSCINMSKLFFFVVVLVAAVVGKDLSRSKRQLSVYYMCGNGGSSYVSQYPCAVNNNCGNGCNYNNVALPNSFYSPYSNCNNGCSNLNCNQYSGQYINGQYIAYATGSNLYSPCASSCCQSFNPTNSVNNGYVVGGIGLNTNDGIYNPYNNVFGNNGLPINNNGISTGFLRRFSDFTGSLTANGMLLCGGSEPAGGRCPNGFCPYGHTCVSGNVCCRCAVGASAGTCSTDSNCSAGYSCGPAGFCCASLVSRTTELVSCVDGLCIDGYECGLGNLCYPAKNFKKLLTRLPTHLKADSWVALVIIMTSVTSLFLAVVLVGAGASVDEITNISREKRTVTYYYLCGTYPNQRLQTQPCNSCNNCGGGNVCQVGCTSSNFCMSRNQQWRCIDGCCKTPSYQPTLPPHTTTRGPAPVCGGREVSGGYCGSRSTCAAGYLCTSSNICCRCAYGTSVGPCVNGQCPENTQCNPNNECCPYQVGK